MPFAAAAHAKIGPARSSNVAASTITRPIDARIASAIAHVADTGEVAEYVDAGDDVERDGRGDTACEELESVRRLTVAPSGAATGQKTSRSAASMRAFSASLAALAPDLRVRALRLTRDPVAADDLVQDAIERALRFADQFEPGTNLRSWAQTIVFSVFVTGYRRRRREREAVRSLTVDPCAWTTPEHVDARAVEAAALDVSPPMRRALDTLPAAYREILLLVDVTELSYRDAADQLGIPVGTVMSRLHRARKQLAAALGATVSPAALAA